MKSEVGSQELEVDKRAVLEVINAGRYDLLKPYHMLALRCGYIAGCAKRELGTEEYLSLVHANVNALTEEFAAGLLAEVRERLTARGIDDSILFAPPYMKD